MAIEGKKGAEWREPSVETYYELDLEGEPRMVDFIDRQVVAETPFFVTYGRRCSAFPRAGEADSAAGSHRRGARADPTSSSAR
jgi:hypothetical protein